MKDYPMRNPSRIKILYLITKSNWSGAQRYVHDLATHLDPSKYDVVVALGGNGRLVNELHTKNIRTITINNLQRDISMFHEFRTIFELWHIIRSEKPDVLHINSSKAGGLGGLIGRLLGVPKIIFTAHGWAFNEDRPQWQRIIIKVLHWITVFLSHTTIVVSEMTKKQMAYPCVTDKMRVIYNGRSISKFIDRTPAREFFCTRVPELLKYQKDFWSVTIGELHHIKQHEVTMAALAKVVQNFPNIRHIIIGDGEEREKLTNLISTLNLQSHVFFTGGITEASEYLKAFDLFILSSRSEALAYVIIEACIAELPIIASRVGGIPEIIQHEKEGLLFPSGDELTLSKYYQELYTNSSKRNELARNAFQRSKYFNFTKSLEETIALYKE